MSNDFANEPIPPDEARRRAAEECDPQPVDERDPPPATNAVNDAPFPSEADYGAAPPPTDEALGLPAGIDTDQPAPPGMVKTGIGYVPEDAVRRARRSQPWPLRTPKELEGRDKESVEYVVRDLIPQREVTLLGGHGGLGKSSMLQMLQVATCLGKPWLDLPTTKMRSLGLYCALPFALFNLGH